jgi:acetyl esterase/lipase
MLKILATCAVIVVGVAWMLHVPVYDGYSTFSKVGNFLTIAKVMHHHIPNAVEFFGLGTKYETIRSLMNFLIKYAPKDFPEVQANDFVFNGVTVRVYWPADFDQLAIKTLTSNGDQSNSTQRRLAALVYYHGGGCVLGSVKQSDNFSRRLVNDLNVVVISVEYRLAPEHIYPAAHDDALNAALYVLEHADELGVDGTRVGVIGDSSGGYLAAATAQSLLKMAQKGGGAKRPSLKLQVVT